MIPYFDAYTLTSLYSSCSPCRLFLLLLSLEKAIKRNQKKRCYCPESKQLKSKGTHRCCVILVLALLSSMEPYVYEPVPSPRSIRLIKVKAKNETEDLVCSLEIADLFVPLEDIALSYAWGDTYNTATVVCHGKAVQVT